MESFQRLNCAVKMMLSGAKWTVQIVLCFGKVIIQLLLNIVICLLKVDITGTYSHCALL